jgi:hypothetical protein
MEPLLGPYVGGKGGLKEVSPLPLGSITAASSYPSTIFPHTYIFLPFPLLSSNITWLFSKWRHMRAPTYRNMAAGLTAQTQITVRRVVASWRQGFVLQACNAEVFTVAVANRRVVICNTSLLHHATHIHQLLEISPVFGAAVVSEMLLWAPL